MPQHKQTKSQFHQNYRKNTRNQKCQSSEDQSSVISFTTSMLRKIKKQTKKEINRAKRAENAIILQRLTSKKATIKQQDKIEEDSALQQFGKSNRSEIQLFRTGSSDDQVSDQEIQSLKRDRDYECQSRYNEQMLGRSSSCNKFQSSWNSHHSSEQFGNNFSENQKSGSHQPQQPKKSTTKKQSQNYQCSSSNKIDIEEAFSDEEENSYSNGRIFDDDTQSLSESQEENIKTKPIVGYQDHMYRQGQINQFGSHIDWIREIFERFEFNQADISKSQGSWSSTSDKEQNQENYREESMSIRE